jgi:hypothetical protein
MSRNTLSIITSCSRPEAIFDVYESVKGSVKKLEDRTYNIYWYIIYDGEKVKEANKRNFTDEDAWIIEGSTSEVSKGYKQRNFALDMIKDGWVCFLDDDNIMHPNFYTEISKHLDEDLNGIVIDQIFKFGNNRLVARLENMRVCNIDIAQYILRREYIGDKRFDIEYCADGHFIEDLYRANPKKFLFINQPLCYYNYLKS